MGGDGGQGFTLGEASREYLVSCRAGGLTKATLTAYSYGLLRFVQYAGETTPLRSLTASGIRTWLAGLADAKSARGKPFSQSTVSQCYRSVHTFVTWCVANHYLEADPMAGVRKPKVDQEVPHFLSVAEMQRFRDALLTSLLPVRNLAVGLVFLDCGARRGEVASAAVADLDITTGVLTIRRGKGGKGRRVPLTSTTIYALRCWLAVRPASLGRSLFGMTGIAIYRMVRSAAHRAGVEVSVHGLRHTFATYYDGPLDDLQKILGHANVETTITIYRHRLDEELIRDHAQRSPLAQLARGRQLGLDLDRKG